MSPTMVLSVVLYYICSCPPTMKKGTNPERITFISTYIPRKCGIATYTKDLIEQLQMQKKSIEVIALNDSDENFQYPSVVTKTLTKNNKEEYVRIAKQINTSQTDIVHIQHEFGIFGGEDGEYILDFARALEKPFIVTFHTILKTPSQKQMEIIKELTRLSCHVIIMKEIGKDRLIHIYGANDRDISIIYHGVPDMDHLKKEAIKIKLGLEKKFILMTSNLISDNKGIEYVIQALPDIVEKIPQVFLLIIGETHPEVKKKEGEKYRSMLEALVKKLGVAEHVQFINEYLLLEKLKEYFVSADIILTPYLEPEQITSGTLAYAIGAGKVCISTPFIYAKNMLKNNRGILIPFKDAGAIISEVISVYTNPKIQQAFGKHAYALGKQMRWPKIAAKHNVLYRDLLKRERQIQRRVARYITQQLDITYLCTNTSTMGIVQHAQGILPNTKSGYSTDDNARALIVIAALYKKNSSPELLALVKGYLGFLFFAQEENGKFHTFLGPDNTWLDKEEVNDASGKAIWALGFFLYSCPNSPFTISTDNMFRKTFRNVSSICDVRTAAFTLFGIYYYFIAFEDKADIATLARESLIQLANYLVGQYKKEKSDTWEWFEKEMAYDNFRLPEALFYAYLATKNEEYKSIAQKTLNFALDANYDKEKQIFDFIGQNGWYKKGGEKADFDQQPLEAASAVSCCCLAYKVTRKQKYKVKAYEAFSWFFGKNRNHAIMTDNQTKGIYDGLTQTGVNENQGSESTICFLLAILDLQKIFKKGSKHLF